MVGGIVIGVATANGESLVNVKERESTSTLAIRVIPKRADNGTPVVIQPGDSIWWQGRQAMWTPKERIGKYTDKPETQGKTWDIVLDRVGYSH